MIKPIGKVPMEAINDGVKTFAKMEAPNGKNGKTHKPTAEKRVMIIPATSQSLPLQFLPGTIA